MGEWKACPLCATPPKVVLMKVHPATKEEELEKSNFHSFSFHPPLAMASEEGMSTPSNTSLTKQRFIRQFLRYNSTASSECEDTDFTTASEVFPMRISLETVQIGSWKYTSAELDDIELLYELETSDLLIKTSVRGTNDGVPAMYRIKSVSAADLSLFSVVPGSLESMVSRLVLETSEKISCSPFDPSVKESNMESHDLDVFIIRMTASVHETGHLRDILVFLLKKDIHGEMIPNSPFIRDKSSTQKVDETQEGDTQASTSQLTLLEGLPWWATYIPWMFYSKNTRIILQRLLVLYTLISVLWAFWQLYRHVDIIRFVIQPIILTLKYYLSSVFEVLDWCFAVFTLWWNTFLSPLNVLRGLLLAPMLQVLVQLRQVFAPIYQVLVSSGLVSTFSTIFSALYRVVFYAGSSLWTLVRMILTPLIYLWQALLNARLKVAAMDFQRLRISWVFNLIVSSVRSISRGLMAVVGYQRQEKKIKRAMANNASSPMVSPVSTPSSAVRRRHNEKMPILYSSPLSKQ